MAAVVGMDPAAIRRLATQLGNSAGQLEAVAVAVQQVIDDAVSQWEGVDGQDFVAAWSGQHRLQLNESAGAVRLLAETASLNADAQDETSSVAGTGLGGALAAAAAAAVASASGGGAPGWLKGLSSVLGALGFAGDRFADGVSFLTKLQFGRWAPRDALGRGRQLHEQGRTDPRRRRGSR